MQLEACVRYCLKACIKPGRLGSAGATPRRVKVPGSKAKHPGKGMELQVESSSMYVRKGRGETKTQFSSLLVHIPLPSMKAWHYRSMKAWHYRWDRQKKPA